MVMKRLYYILLLCMMAVACTPDSAPSYKKTLGTPSDTEIWYTTNDGTMIMTLDEGAFDAKIIAHTYNGDKGVIEFAEPLRRVGARAFERCNRVDNISLPSSVESIGEYAFNDCNALECISLGASLRTIGTDAFEGSYNLTTVHIASIADWCNISFETPHSNPIYCAGTICVNGAPVRKLEIPEGVTTIRKYAFNNLVTISSVAMPTTLQMVEERAFEDCLSLAGLYIKSVESWCAVTFADIYANPLYYAETLYVQGERCADLELASGVQSISNYAFINANSLTSLLIGDSVKSVGKSAFNSCMSLKECIIGDGVKTIDDEAFRNCVSMKSLSLGAFVQSIGKYAFMNCAELQTIYCYATTPPSLAGSDTFAYGPDRRTFYVPEESLYEYKENDAWEQYASITFPIPYYSQE